MIFDKKNNQKQFMKKTFDFGRNQKMKETFDKRLTKCLDNKLLTCDITFCLFSKVTA